MEKWKVFEAKVVEFLEAKLAKYSNLKVEAFGASDSHKSDIVISFRDSSKENINIEVKLSPAQSGQFVLFPNDNDKSFKFSNANFFKEKELPTTSKIISAMESSFDSFKTPTTKGVSLNNVGEDVLAQWIKEFYLNHKKSSFIIVGSSKSLKCSDAEFGDTICIFPTEKLSGYLEVSATYRVKKSGSSAYNFKEDFIKAGKTKCLLEKLGNKTYIAGFDKIKDAEKLETKSILEAKIDRLHIAKNGELRKKSKTANANVIFSLKLKDGIVQSASHLAKFESAVNCI